MSGEIETVDVLIAGAGPVGTTLGLLLAKSGHIVSIVERDAGVDAVPSRPITGVAQPASPVEGGAAPEAVELRSTDDGGVDIRKVDVAAGQGADAPAPPAEAKH